MARDGIHTNDRQLACARINSKEGQDYLVRIRVPAGSSPCTASSRMRAGHALTLRSQAAMACAANYAWVNRSSMTFLCRQACGRRGNQRLADSATDATDAQAFAKMFTCTPDDLDMHVVYDVSHNIAKACAA